MLILQHQKSFSTFVVEYSDDQEEEDDHGPCYLSEVEMREDY
jgi:hypothetical protein